MESREEKKRERERRTPKMDNDDVRHWKNEQWCSRLAALNERMMDGQTPLQGQGNKRERLWERVRCQQRKLHFHLSLSPPPSLSFLIWIWKKKKKKETTHWPNTFVSTTVHQRWKVINQNKFLPSCFQSNQYSTRKREKEKFCLWNSSLAQLMMALFRWSPVVRLDNENN